MLMKANSTLVISLVALALSIISLFGRHSMCVPEVVLTLIGVCTTIIVGVSVVDVLTLRSIYQKLDQIKEIERNIEATNERIDVMREQSNMCFHIAWGVAVLSWQPHTAIKECWKSVRIAMSLEDAQKSHSCIDITEKIVKRIKERPELSRLYKRTEDIPKEIDESMKKSQLYSMYRVKLKDIIKEVDRLSEIER